MAGNIVVISQLDCIMFMYSYVIMRVHVIVVGVE